MTCALATARRGAPDERRRRDELNYASRASRSRCGRLKFARVRRAVSTYLRRELRWLPRQQHRTDVQRLPLARSNVTGQINKTPRSRPRDDDLHDQRRDPHRLVASGVVVRRGNVLKAASSRSGTRTTEAVPAPAARWHVRVQVAWYGNRYGVSNGAGWALEPLPETTATRTVAVTSFCRRTPPPPRSCSIRARSASAGERGRTASLTAQVRNTDLAAHHQQHRHDARARRRAPSTPGRRPPYDHGGAGGSAALASATRRPRRGRTPGYNALTTNATNGPTTNLAVSGTCVVSQRRRSPTAPRRSRSATSPGRVVREDLHGVEHRQRHLDRHARARGRDERRVRGRARLPQRRAGRQPGRDRDLRADRHHRRLRRDPVSTNDTTNANVSVGVSGAGVAAPAPNISLAPASLAFGTVATGGTACSPRRSATPARRRSPSRRSRAARTPSRATSSPGRLAARSRLPPAARGGHGDVRSDGRGRRHGLPRLHERRRQSRRQAWTSRDGAGAIGAQARGQPRVVASGAYPPAPRREDFAISNTGNAPLTGTLARASGTKRGVHALLRLLQRRAARARS